MGVLFPALQLAAQAPQSEKFVGIATAIFTFVHSFRQTFGVTIGRVIFQNEFEKGIAKQVLLGTFHQIMQFEVMMLQHLYHC